MVEDACDLTMEQKDCLINLIDKISFREDYSNEQKVSCIKYWMKNKKEL